MALNRPEQRNALSVDMCREIVGALESIDGDEGARVLVVRGEGTVFCSGADFAAASKGLDFVPAFEHMLEAVARFRLPTLARIHGAALGGGLQLATVCDFRIAESDARLGIPSSRLGVLVNLENVRRLVLLAGVATAKEVLMGARTYSGTEARAAGLVNRCVPSDELDAAVSELADALAALAPLAVQGVKQAIGAVLDSLGDVRSLKPEAAADIDRAVAEVYASRDLGEGLRAASEKRPPDFTGR